MNKMKRIFTILISISVLAAIAFAQGGAQKPADSKAGAMPTADQIIEKYVQAIGGKAALEKQTSRVSKGSFELPAFGASGTAEVYEKAPNKTATVIDIAGFGIVQEGFDGKVGWSKDPQSGLREKTGAELAAAKLDAEFFKPIKIKQLYPKLVVKGKDKVNDKEVYVIEATPADSTMETWYFDTQTGFMVRQDAEREGPQGKQAIQVFLDNYKEVDGIKLPFNLHQVTPQFTIDIKIQDVKHNVPIDDAKFNKPAAQ
jgi:outer membrane lipoprotein-sorting protein